MTAILGISCYYHDSAACLVVDGEIVAAAQEERFTRKKHDAGFPTEAVRYCLAEGGVEAGALDVVAFYDKPLLKFHRILETYLAVAPGGLRSFVQAVPLWLREKLWIPPRIEQALAECGVGKPGEILFTEHHESHAASAFYPSPFERAAVLTLDGVGEWATTTVGHGVGGDLEPIAEIPFPHSLGLLYSAFTYFTGFRVNSGEYKLMGLAPYGEPKYADLIRDHLIDLRDDGSFRLNLDYFGYLDSLRMTNRRFDELFGGPPRKPEAPITQRERDLARSIQVVTEEAVLSLARFARRETGERHLCLAGGVALNCVANGILLREGIFDQIWIQPAAGDAGGALGAALSVWHNALGNERHADGRRDRMSGAYLGPGFSDDEVRAWLDHQGYPYRELPDAEWAPEIARLIAEENVVGLHHGRMEFGPRALGNRSIVGDARSAKMQSVMNLKIKYRESFRPFAPSVLGERVSEWFEMDVASPYMLLVADVAADKRLPEAGDEAELSLQEWVNRPRSEIPAVTHVDHSARVQTVHADTNPRYHALISEFEKLTGCAVIVNTSFNVRGEPIVCTPEDAYRCFMRTEMDHLVLGPFLLDKKEQPELPDKVDWREEFQLD
ncbi:MAG TPA: carbamoyltransferase [Thermoanaerobaculia bacterium]|nr:carbamoyltransferase [Thermoanaerobaculia bacterium]